MEELFMAEDSEDYVFAVMILEPKTEAEWRSIVKDPSKFVAKKMAKGVEVSWQKLNATQKQAMREAKALPERMRWVLVFKQTDTPGMVKAKARLVVLGFTDPDVGLVSVRSPTIDNGASSRPTRRPPSCRATWASSTAKYLDNLSRSSKMQWV